jgi:hypothetical protein
MGVIVIVIVGVIGGIRGFAARRFFRGRISACGRICCVRWACLRVGGW